MTLGSKFFARWALISIANGLIFALAMALLSWLGVWPVFVIVLLLSGMNALVQEAQRQIAEKIVGDLGRLNRETKAAAISHPGPCDAVVYCNLCGAALQGAPIQSHQCGREVTQ